MIPNPHSRRFDPRLLSTPIKTDGEELFEALDADLGSAATESTNDPDLRDFDEALEQIVFGRVQSLSPLRGDRGPRWTCCEPRTIRPQSRHNP